MMQWHEGRLEHIHIAPQGDADMIGLEEATLIAGQGIEGDRYAIGNGSYSDKPDIREVTLIEAEVLDALAANQPPLQKAPIILAPHEHRRNLTTRGVPLNYLVGMRFRVGKVVLQGGRLNFPCNRLAERTGKPVMLPLYNRSGLNCRVVEGGMIRRGDRITPL